MKIYKYQSNTKYLSRKEAYTQLKVSHKDFKKLCILTNTKPVKAKNTQKYDHGDTIFYEISDIQKIIDSKEYDNLLYKNKIKNKKIEYENSYMPERTKYLPEIEYNYKDILMKKYATFNDAVIGLNETLKYYNKEFNAFVFQYNLIEKIYLTNNNIFFKVKIEEIEIMYNYLVPENGEYKYLYNLSYYHVHFVLHKLKKLVQEKWKCTLFKGLRFKLHDEDALLRLVIEHCGGSIENEFDIYITDDKIDDFDIQKIYLQPQFLFDSFNKRTLCSYDLYRVGKELPIHEVPESSKVVIDESVLAVMSKTKRRKYEEYTKQ